ncbi:methyltransferase domain-containing protein [Hoeflea marina]|nr:methyltransferase domain-containing protein [Hoeflea marina]
MEKINRRTWSNPLDRRYYRKSKGYLNHGERTVFEAALERGGYGTTLDIGVGGGRTAALLVPVVRDYVGIDYTPEMTALARSNYPGFDFRTMDARDLSAFPDGHFDLVVFSYNGIDSVGPEGREAILREVSRVLKPTGAFAFSTFNRNWTGFVGSRAGAGVAWTPDPLRLAYRLVMHGLGRVRRRLYMPLEQREGEHAILLHPAHNFGIMVYTTTPSQLRAQLAAAGFAGDPDLYSDDGARLSSGTLAEVEQFHVLAFKQLPGWPRTSGSMPTA